MSSITGFNFDRELMRVLLERLRDGMLDLNEARQLRPLLVNAYDEAIRTKDSKRLSYLRSMIHILDMYISGEINLLEPIEVSNLSNVD
jgi:hypothetical protein